MCGLLLVLMKDIYVIVTLTRKAGLIFCWFTFFEALYKDSSSSLKINNFLEEKRIQLTFFLCVLLKNRMEKRSKMN